MEDVEVIGLRVVFERRGRGPCLLLLHGAVSDSRVWRGQLESLSDSFTVVAWDAPGCGGSSDPPDHFRLVEYAECLGCFIDALGLEQLHVLGHSWGSALALELYHQRPEIVRLATASLAWNPSVPTAIRVGRRSSSAHRAEGHGGRAHGPIAVAFVVQGELDADPSGSLRAA